MTLPTLTARYGFQLSFVPFPLGALIRQRRQRELQRLHLLVHHACKVTCHAGQAHRLADRRVAALPASPGVVRSAARDGAGAPIGTVHLLREDHRSSEPAFEVQ